MIYENIQATIVRVTAIGLVKQEVKLSEIDRQDYAQYRNVPFCVYVAKQCRKRSKLIICYNPEWVVLEGWNLPEVDGNVGLSYSQEVSNSLDQYIDECLLDSKVIFDSRTK